MEFKLDDEILEELSKKTDKIKSEIDHDKIVEKFKKAGSDALSGIEDFFAEE